MKRLLNTIFLVLIIILQGFAQNVTIFPSGISPNTNYTRTSYDSILSINNPKKGDYAYDSTFLCLRIYNGKSWVPSYSSLAENNSNIAIIAQVENLPNGSTVNPKVIKTDSLLNIYIGGYFTGSCIFGSNIKVSNGSSDAFIAKYNSNGNLEWIKTWGADSGERIYDLELNNLNEIVVLGTFSNTVNFDGNVLTSSGGSDIFLAKLNTNGIIIWIQKAGGIGTDVGTALSIDSKQNLIITGYYNRTAFFGNYSITTNGNFSDIFIAKYDSSGNIKWLKTAGGVNFDLSFDSAISTNGNVYLIGYFSNSTTFDSFSKTSPGGDNLFVAKFDTLQKMFISLNTVNSGGSGQYVFGQSISIDKQGSIIVSGIFKGTAYFENQIISARSTDLFILKFNNFDLFSWVRSIGISENESNSQMVTDSKNNILLTGGFNRFLSVDFTNKKSKGLSDGFIIKLDSLGDGEWINSGGSDLDDYCSALTIGPNSNIYLLGTYGTTPFSFGNSTITSSTSNGFYIGRIQEN
jgi:hypothetical protein